MHTSTAAQKAAPAGSWWLDRCTDIKMQEICTAEKSAAAFSGMLMLTPILWQQFTLPAQHVLIMLIMCLHEPAASVHPAVSCHHCLNPPGLTLNLAKMGSATIASIFWSGTFTNRMFSSQVRRTVPSPYVSAMRANSCTAKSSNRQLQQQDMGAQGSLKPQAMAVAATCPASTTSHRHQQPQRLSGWTATDPSVGVQPEMDNRNSRHQKQAGAGHKSPNDEQVAMAGDC